jgi:hypothetical protein
VVSGYPLDDATPPVASLSLRACPCRDVGPYRSDDGASRLSRTLLPRDGAFVPLMLPGCLTIFEPRLGGRPVGAGSSHGCCVGVAVVADLLSLFATDLTMLLIFSV